MRNILFIAIASISVFGCTKHGSVQPQNATPTLDTVTRYPLQNYLHSGAKDGGEDTDPIIIIEQVVGPQNSLIVNADVVAYNSTDTVAGTTDDYGRCKIYLPNLGTWYYSITHSGYAPINVTLNLQDTVTLRRDTMHL